MIYKTTTDALTALNDAIDQTAGAYDCYLDFGDEVGDVNSGRLESKIIKVQADLLAVLTQLKDLRDQLVDE